jgi:hypothetical protein
VALTHNTDDRLFVLPATIGGRRRRLRNRIAGIGVVVLVAGGIVTWQLLGQPMCGPGVARIGGQCIGVTAGDFAFNPGDPQFSAAENRIRRLNDQVTASGEPYATVALLSPMTWSATSDMSRVKVIHELQGAAIALADVDDRHLVGDAPQVELLLANEGTDEEQYSRVIGQLTGLTTGDHPLDAVIGLGVSKGATRSGAKLLSDAGLLMVGSNLTGDGLDSSQVPGLSRVSTPNSDDVTAVARYLTSLRTRPKTMLVYAQQRKGDNTDYYTSTLADDFRHQMGQYTVVPEELFDPTEVANSFSVISTNLCTSGNPPNTVLYAGREPDLPTFIRDLAGRPCQGRPITLAAGDDSCSLISDSDDQRQENQIRTELRTGRITVVCPAWAAPESWVAAPSTAPATFGRFAADYENQFTAGQGFGTELDDGYAIMTHDALLTAAKAITLATVRSVPAPALVLGNQFRMDSDNFVPGASGMFRFVVPNRGNPSGKRIYVLQLQPTGPPLVRFTTMTAAG